MENIFVLEEIKTAMILRVFHQLCFACACLLVSYYVTILLHELGHFLFGRLSGYYFLAIQIGKLYIVKRNKIHIGVDHRRIAIGQCLFYPVQSESQKCAYTMPESAQPESQKCAYTMPESAQSESQRCAYTMPESVQPESQKCAYTMPESNNTILMLLGGGITNLLTGLFFSIMFIRFVPSQFCFFFLLMGYLGLFAAFTNLIPGKYNRLETDGLCIKNLYQNQEANRYNHQQMFISLNLIEGYSYAEMKEELFELSVLPNLCNDIIASMQLYCYYRYIDMEDYDQAMLLITELVKFVSFLNGQLRIDIEMEYEFCRVICGGIAQVNFEKLNLNGTMHVDNAYMIRILAINDFFNGNKEKLSIRLEQLNQMSKKCLYKGESRFNLRVIHNIIGIGGVHESSCKMVNNCIDSISHHDSASFFS